MNELPEVVVWCTAVLVAVFLSSAVTAVILWLVSVSDVSPQASLLVVGACLLAGAGITTGVAKAAGALISKARGE